MKPEDILRIAREESEKQRFYKYRINICCSSGCLPFGALNLLKTFENSVKEFGVESECKVARTGCPGTCSVGPVVLVEPGGYIYQNVTPEKAREMVKSHIVAGIPVKEYLYANEAFFKKQFRLVLRNAGKIDPMRIEDYMAAGGYQAFIKCLTKMTPREVIDEVIASGL
ncbi:NAD(P)H-dependent oxidoreductase subunit E, partial [Candidatus Bathyarchaeota archaeon]|nr:NAD(P)H-dependent oxidoreductase subunit E [Candidatus Bathyarchaeota archaeon]